MKRLLPNSLAAVGRAEPRARPYEHLDNVVPRFTWHDLPRCFDDQNNRGANFFWVQKAKSPGATHRGYNADRASPIHLLGNINRRLLRVNAAMACIAPSRICFRARRIDAVPFSGKVPATTPPLRCHSVDLRLGRKNRPRGGFFISDVLYLSIAVFVMEQHP